MKEDITKIIIGYGWEPIESKNSVMLSFTKGCRRMNFYFTTGTFTIQERDGKCKTYRDTRDFDQVDTMLNDVEV